MEDNFSTDRGGGDGSGGNMSSGERWGAAVNTDEASLPRPPLPSCRAALFLRGRGPVPGVGDPRLSDCLLHHAHHLPSSLL